MNPLKQYWRDMRQLSKLLKRGRSLSHSHLPSRYSVKSQGLARGQVLRSSRVVHDCNIERVFKLYKS